MIGPGRCAIWNSPATIKAEKIDHTYYDSSRAGGLYRIGDLAAARLEKLTPPQRACLTTWLQNQRIFGEECPTVTNKLVQEVESFRPLSTTQRIERALLFFEKRIRVGGEITTPSNDEFDAHDGNAIELAMFTECASKRELLSLLGLIIEMGYLRDHRQEHSALGRFTPTAKGWLRIEELVNKRPDASQAFVAMWFNQATDDPYKLGIKPAIEDLGYKPVRIDGKEHVNKIDDEIIAELRRSKFLVADFTCEKEKARGGVYFEAGYAMALPIPVIWTCHKDSMNDVHFDTRQYNHIVWETPQDLYRMLKARVGAVIGENLAK
jgi:nucleoside 2-deoxyribosyltransferase